MFDSIEILDRITFKISDTETCTGIVIGKIREQQSLETTLYEGSEQLNKTEEFLIVLPESPESKPKKTELKSGYHSRLTESAIESRKTGLLCIPNNLLSTSFQRASYHVSLMDEISSPFERMVKEEFQKVKEDLQKDIQEIHKELSTNKGNNDSQNKPK